jgi:hypothetical protein
MHRAPIPGDIVAPIAGAWIETVRVSEMQISVLVVLSLAWIET